MRIGRLRTADAIVHARRTETGWVPVEDPYAALAEGHEPSDLEGQATGELLPPADSRVVIGIAQNGPDHHSPVQAWLKSPRTVVASGVEVVLRRDAGTPFAEGEIAVVIGRDTEGLTAANAHDYVLGVTAVNDFSSHDRAEFDPRNFESKSGDGYTPLGPWIDTDADIDDVELILEVDGETIAETGSRELPSAIRECLAYVASWARLGPGDVIMTGAPKTLHPVQPGAVIAVQVAGMTLVTPTR